MDFSNILFRCSSLGHIMVEPRSKSEVLSETCKTHLVDVYVSNKYNRQSDVFNRYMEKGLMVEEDSITLYSRVKKRFFKKNEQHLHNDFIKGTPDLFTGLEIFHADEIIDTKSSWDIFTFFRVHTQSLNKMYYWQMQGYMALSGAAKATLVYCLVNTPQSLIDDEKRKLLYKMNAGHEGNSDYIKACEELDKLMTYDDIPMSERVIEFTIHRSQDDIERMYERVEKCREYLNQFERSVNPQFVLAEYKPKDKLIIVT